MGRINSSSTNTKDSCRTSKNRSRSKNWKSKRDSALPYARHFLYGIRHISLWFHEVCPYASLGNNGICRFPYENDTPTGLPNRCFEKAVKQYNRIIYAIHTNIINQHAGSLGCQMWNYQSKTITTILNCNSITLKNVGTLKITLKSNIKEGDNENYTETMHLLFRNAKVRLLSTFLSKINSISNSKFKSSYFSPFLCINLWAPPPPAPPPPAPPLTHSTFWSISFNIATHVALILFLFSSWINYLLYDTKSVMVFWKLLSKINHSLTIS